MDFFGVTGRKTTATLTVCECQKVVHSRRCRFVWQYVLIFLLCGAYVSCKMTSSSKPPIDLDQLLMYAADPNLFTGNYRRNIYNQSTNRLYVDVGCFNGDSIEQFIHFTPDSHLFDIFTFEPDPENYHLCKKRLEQEKFRKHNIHIIPRVAWVRDEKVLYRVNKGFYSRIEAENNSTVFSTYLDAIDFSAWLSRIFVKNKTFLQLRFSMPEAEVAVLESLIMAGLLGLAERVDVEWTDRSKLTLRAKRIYIQSSFDGLGFAMAHMTRPSEAQKVVERKGTWRDVPKYFDWKKIPESDTITSFIQRPTVIDPPRTTRKWPLARP